MPTSELLGQLTENPLHTLPSSAHEKVITNHSVYSTLAPILLVSALLVFTIHRNRQFLQYALNFLKLKFLTYRFLFKKQTITDVFEERLPKLRDKPALIFEQQTLTFGDVERESNRLARWLSSLNLPGKACVGLLMESRPEFIIVWLAAAKIDLKIALINATMRGNSLYHAICEAEAKVLIFGSECQAQVFEVCSQLPSDLPIFSFPDVRFKPQTSIRRDFPLHTEETKYELPLYKFPENKAKLSSNGEMPRVLDLSPLVNRDAEYSFSGDSEPIPRHIRKTTSPHDSLFLIFTSGTTGLPKAARVSHTRIFMAGLSFALFNNVNSSDVIYCPLPLYHSAAGLLGVGMSWCVGAPLVVKRKFSASNFFKDCFEYDVTVIQYIGQLCRYLLASPPTLYDTRHKIRKAIGNGLRADVWEKFQKRFRIPYVGEFYGSTEGNATLVNTMNRLGACGYLPHITTLFYPAKLIRVIGSDMDPQRGSDGLCQECDYNEPGELLGKITSDPLRQFTGYTRDSESKKKILENVFEKGDRWFRTGDLLKKDAEGFLYFVDRLGDTFRWKGENCACNQVESAISELSPVEDVVVYGVPIPGYEDKAGMACIILKDNYQIVSDSHEDVFYKKDKTPLQTIVHDVSSSSSSTSTMNVNSQCQHHIVGSASTPSSLYPDNGESKEIISPTHSATFSAVSSSAMTAFSAVPSSIATSSTTTAESIPPSVLESIRITDVTESTSSPFQSFSDKLPSSIVDLVTKEDIKQNGEEAEQLHLNPKLKIEISKVSLKDMYRELNNNLAKWQIPVFIRFTIPGGIDSTATFKHNKTRLLKESFTPKLMPQTDSLFLCDDKAETYVPLTQSVYEDIVAGRLRL